MSDKKKAPAWETIAVFAAIFALWPAVMRFWAANAAGAKMEDMPLESVMKWESPAWDILMYAALAVMVLIAVRRIRRLNAARDDDDDHSGPVDPYGSMMGGTKDKK